ncbi:Retinal-specific ATP-binding cassette transporter [Tetrabaena socialis]|uniref:Retinal-specific ATP-binding cassette transporter n=1 Tax=Tetrabaena socialis TaxID=47790 RepID=A0A2J7ZR07_9CHLO|nr:Retinal-specific ATP-binding cassette transporter [Tetrabaena socialis]|eukprot:PNH02705.1 Retinal-specific ATP-binding cassette transporter [Tetrabaena socialis]
MSTLLAYEAQIQRDAASLMLVLCMVLASAVLSASYVVFIVREQDNNSKHLQLVSGAPPTAYWAANYLWDLTSFSISAAGIIALIASYRLPQYSGSRLAAVAGLLWGFGPAGLSLTYLLHYCFRVSDQVLSAHRGPGNGPKALLTACCATKLYTAQHISKDVPLAYKRWAETQQP